MSQPSIPPLKYIFYCWSFLLWECLALIEGLDWSSWEDESSWCNLFGDISERNLVKKIKKNIFNSNMRTMSNLWGEYELQRKGLSQCCLSEITFLVPTYLVRVLPIGAFFMHSCFLLINSNVQVENVGVD